MKNHNQYAEFVNGSIIQRISFTSGTSNSQ
jgi:hypothetical protein